MRFSASVSLMFRERPLLERFAAAREAGFEGVEIQNLEEGDPAAMARAAEQAGVTVVLVNVPLADYAQGGPGLSGVPGRESRFRDAVRRASDATDLLGAAMLHLGPSRVPPGTDRDACLATYRQNVAFAVDFVPRNGPALLVEAMNRIDAPTALLADVDDAARIVRHEFGGRLGLQFDVYHAAMNGTDVMAAFAAHRDLVRHVQFADAPGRQEPGTGTIDFAALLPAIAQQGYTGWFGAEYRPSRQTEATLEWMSRLSATDTP